MPLVTWDWVIRTLRETASLHPPTELNVRTLPRLTRVSQKLSACVPESGNMLIMALAHARISGDGSLIFRYVRSHISCLFTCTPNIDSNYSMTS